MNTITLSWEDWRAVIGVLRAKKLPYMREHADLLEQQLEQHPPDQETVTLHLTDDVFLRSSNGARWQLGIPLPVEEDDSPQKALPASAQTETPRCPGMVTTAALLAHVRSREGQTRIGDAGSVIARGGLSRAMRGSTDRHGAGVSHMPHRTDLGQGSAAHRSAVVTSSDPRRGIVPRDGGGWPERSE